VTTREGVVDGAKFVYHQWEDSRWANPLKVMVWVDVNCGGMSTGTETEVNTVGHGPDGQRVDWQFAVADGKFAKLRVKGTDYDPTNGTLFLVSTRGGPSQVRQLATPLPEPGSGLEGCEAFGRGDPDVAKLIETAKAQ
jgi:hypothetical protein